MAMVVEMEMVTKAFKVIIATMVSWITLDSCWHCFGIPGTSYVDVLQTLHLRGLSSCTKARLYHLFPSLAVILLNVFVAVVVVVVVVVGIRFEC